MDVTSLGRHPACCGRQPRPLRTTPSARSGPDPKSRHSVIPHERAGRRLMERSGVHEGVRVPHGVCLCRWDQGPSSWTGRYSPVDPEAGLGENCNTQGLQVTRANSTCFWRRGDRVLAVQHVSPRDGRQDRDRVRRSCGAAAGGLAVCPGPIRSPRRPCWTAPRLPAVSLPPEGTLLGGAGWAGGAGVGSCPEGRPSARRGAGGPL